MRLLYFLFADTFIREIIINISRIDEEHKNKLEKKLIKLKNNTSK